MTFKDYLFLRRASSLTFYGEKGTKLRKLYKGNLFDVQEKGFNELVGKLRSMKEAGIDISPIFKDVIQAFKRNMRVGFKARQTPDEPPQRWVKLSKQYAKWKLSHLGKKVANLIGKTGRLKSAVWGGPGWFENISQTRAEWGIAGIPYAAAHQYGYPLRNLPARRYFLAERDQFPQAVLNYMISRIEQHLTGAQ